jgi:shikimate dehydrogenase
MKLHSNIEIIEWDQIGKNIPDFDMIINTTSLGLKNDDKIKLDYNKIGTNKLFYDVIYNPSKTNFLTKGKALGNQIENGKMMFIYQAQLAFDLWHGVLPKIDKETIKILDI